MRSTTTSRMFDRVDTLSDNEIIRLAEDFIKHPHKGSLFEQIAVMARYENLRHNNALAADQNPPREKSAAEY